jgi:crotonobetainyl-CoA:carnitine CoA-transferase CaiB-like acyl-CoA transferase
MTRSKEQLNEFITSQRSSDCYQGLPLQGKRVLDMSTVMAAPYAAAMLGDAGADVIKIEHPKIPDALRSWGTIKELGIEPYHSVVGRNKFPVTLNLKSDEGKELFLELIKQSDVLIENFRVGAMGRLGLSHDDLIKANPGLIVGKVSGYGLTGPQAQQPGFGTLAESYSGFSYLNGSAGGGPTSPPHALADLTTGIHLAYAISLAFIQQERGVKGGQVIDISLYEPLFGYFGGEFLSYKLTGINPEPIGNELRAAAPRNVYRTKDKAWIALSCSAQKPWENLALLMDREELIQDERFLTNNDRIEPGHRTALNDIIQEWHSSRTEEEVLELFRSRGITAGPVLTMADIDTDEHYKERGSFCVMDDPATGVELKMPGLPFRMLGKPSKIRFPGLPHGSANEAVYGELLNYSPEKVAELRDQGAI